MLRYQISSSDPQERAANLLLRMTDVARVVCMSVGTDAVGNVDGAPRILRISRERFAPDAIDSILQDVEKWTFSDARTSSRVRIRWSLARCDRKRRRACFLEVRPPTNLSLYFACSMLPCEK